MTNPFRESDSDRFAVLGRERGERVAFVRYRALYDDSFVVAKIPELNVYKKVYFGDLAPEDNNDDDDDATDRKSVV